MITESFVLQAMNASLTGLTAGSGNKAILFLHGSGMSARNWLPQLADETLAKHYKLIAVDLPGHGHTRLLNDDLRLFTLAGITELLPPLLAACSADEFLLAGLSFGTNVIGEIKEPLPGCKGIVLASPCIVNNQTPPAAVITAGPYGHVIAMPSPSEEDLRAYVNSHYVPPALAEQYMRDFMAADPRFREQLGQFVMNAGWTDELANIQRWGFPVCVVFGANDSLLKTNYLDGFAPLWQGQTFKLENAGHFVNEEQPEAFNRLLAQYAEDCFK